MTRSTGPATDRARRRPPRALAAAVVAAFVVASGGCGVTNDPQAKEIPANQLPFGLAETTTSSTTLPPTTTVTVAPTVATTVLPTTTVPSYGQTVYLVATGGHVRAVERTIEQRPSLDTAVSLLVSGPAGTDGSDVSSLVTPGLVQDVRASGGTAVVTVGAVFDALDPISQLLATAQLVYTLTALPGIGRVGYVEGGNPLPMWLPDGTQTAQTIARDDYSALVN